MPPTMQDIARECGLSLMTVSRALRGHARVSAATREKVLKKAESLNYEINVLAQNFALKRSGFIGVAAPFQGLIGSSYFGEIIRGFQRVFTDDKRNFALFDTHSTTFNEGKKLEKLWRTRTVEGLLILAPDANEKYLDTFTELHMPLIVVGKTVANSRVCCVGCEDYNGIQMTCEHLYGLGHRDIAFIGGPVLFSVAQMREKAYLDFCHSHGLETLAYRGDYSTESGVAGSLSLLKSNRPPTAIIAANDIMAMAAIQGARELGLAVPEQVSIAGFDDLPAAASCFPPLTTVHQPVVEMAEQSARLLLEWVENGVIATGQHSLPVSLNIRKSTGPVVL